MTEITIDCVAGSAAAGVVTWKDDQGAAQNLTGWSAKLSFRKTPTSDVVFSLSQGSGISTDASGNINITITSTQTALPLGVYKGDLKVAAPASSNWYHVARFLLRISDTFTS